MRRFNFLAAGVTALALAATPALAQQGPGPGAIDPHYGYGGMMGGQWGGGGWHHGFIFHPFLSILVGCLVIALIARLVFGFRRGRWYRHYPYPGAGADRFRGPGGGSSRALDILQERLAKGEIGKEEYEATRKLLLE